MPENRAGMSSLYFSLEASYYFQLVTGKFPRHSKNLGRLWLAYTELQGNLYMLQLMTDDSGHFTQPELRNDTNTSIM